MENKNGCITINMGCCNRGTIGAPVGTVITYMGNKAPEGYLTCDGAEYNIAEYLYLAEHIRMHFEHCNFFGGDGETTFAVPDLRNKFLRGYHGDSEEQLSGAVGIHQEGTWQPALTDVSGKQIQINYRSGYTLPVNADKLLDRDGYIYTLGTMAASAAAAGPFQSRPVNVAVLYCIRYEQGNQ